MAAVCHGHRRRARGLPRRDPRRPSPPDVAARLGGGHLDGMHGPQRSGHLLRMPEPRRGDQDAVFEEDLALVVPGGTDVADLAEMTGLLPAPRRTGTLDYERATPREVGRELLRIPSMWFGVMSITISQLLLSSLQFWAVPYFKRVHHLGAAEAGAYTALLGIGSVAGVLGGGFLADRFLRRGIINARVYGVAFTCMSARVFLGAAFAR